MYGKIKKFPNHQPAMMIGCFPPWSFTPAPLAAAPVLSPARVRVHAPAPEARDAFARPMCGFKLDYPLVNVYIAMENHHVYRENSP